jgi:hypothetical protein
MEREAYSVVGDPVEWACTMTLIIFSGTNARFFVQEELYHRDKPPNSLRSRL